MKRVNQNSGFSLIEVVLAMGIFLITILALVGLLGPTLTSVDEVQSTDEVESVVNSVNAFLQNSPAIGGTSVGKFNNIYNAVENNGYATLLVFRRYVGTGVDVGLKVGFVNETVSDNAEALVAVTDLVDASGVLVSGTLYRVLLTPSSVIPLNGDDGSGNQVAYRSADRDPASNSYNLLVDINSYWEGYFAMEVRIFAEEVTPDFAAGDLDVAPDDLADVEPLFTYNTAIVR